MTGVLLPGRGAIAIRWPTDEYSSEAVDSALAVDPSSAKRSTVSRQERPETGSVWPSLVSHLTCRVTIALCARDVVDRRPWTAKQQTTPVSRPMPVSAGSARTCPPTTGRRPISSTASSSSVSSCSPAAWWWHLEGSRWTSRSRATPPTGHRIRRHPPPLPTPTLTIRQLPGAGRIPSLPPRRRSTRHLQHLRQPHRPPPRMMVASSAAVVVALTHEPSPRRQLRQRRPARPRRVRLPPRRLRRFRRLRRLRQPPVRQPLRQVRRLPRRVHRQPRRSRRQRRTATHRPRSSSSTNFSTGCSKLCGQTRRPTEPPPRQSPSAPISFWTSDNRLVRSDGADGRSPPEPM